jgi:hypothetical protein
VQRHVDCMLLSSQWKTPFGVQTTRLILPGLSPLRRDFIPQSLPQVVCQGPSDLGRVTRGLPDSSSLPFSFQSKSTSQNIRIKSALLALFAFPPNLEATLGRDIVPVIAMPCVYLDD